MAFCGQPAGVARRKIAVNRCWQIVNASYRVVDGYQRIAGGLSTPLRLSIYPQPAASASVRRAPLAPVKPCYNAAIRRKAVDQTIDQPP